MHFSRCFLLTAPCGSFLKSSRQNTHLPKAASALRQGREGLVPQIGSHYSPQYPPTKWVSEAGRGGQRIHKEPMGLPNPKALEWEAREMVDGVRGAATPKEGVREVGQQMRSPEKLLTGMEVASPICPAPHQMDALGSGYGGQFAVLDTHFPAVAPKASL